VLTLGDPPIVKSVTARDARTVVVVLTQPRIDIKTALAFTPILKPTIFSNKTYGTDVKALGQLGSGPFRLTSFQAGSFAEFERFTGFFEPVLPDRIHLQAITDSGALALALRSGQVSVAEGLAKPDWDTLARSGFQRIVADASVEADLLIGYPKDHALADKRVRRAVALAMNRQAYSKTFFNSGTAVVSSNPIVNPGMAGYVASLRPAPYSPKAAQALMAAAGVKSANLSIVVPTVGAPVSSMPGIAQAIANDLEKIGIKMKVIVSDPTSLSGGIGKHAFESTIVAPGGQPDPFILFELFARKAAYYAPGYISAVPSITKALNAAEKARTTAQRNRYLQQIITTMVQDSLIIPISSVGYSVLAKPGVKNFALSGTQIDSWHRVTGLPG
jgi:ABC-type transport system substrate-binding protein